MLANMLHMLIVNKLGSVQSYYCDNYLFQLLCDI